MKIYDVTITRHGYVQVEAESEIEAMEIADTLRANQIHWSDDYESIDAKAYDY